MTGDRELRQGRKAATVAAPSGCQVPVIDHAGGIASLWPAGALLSYLVLARKWRPSTFDEVIGQSHVTRTLKNAIELGRVAHALLFTGSRGIGKTSCARILAKALNCEQGPTVNPCGVCPACVEIGSGSSVDVFEIDGASNNSVEQIREIRESVKFLPTRGKRKMYIIDEVHMLSTSAFNALLKTLEEPPEHVLFVFATTEPHKIPDTILSRCQRYDFKRISEQAIVDALTNITSAEGLTVETGALAHIAREAQGGMRDSLSLLDQVIAFCGLNITESQTREVLGIADRQVFFELTHSILNGDGQHCLERIDDLFRMGLDLQKFAGEFVRHLRDLMVVRICQDPQRLVDIPVEEVAIMSNQVKDIDPARLHRLFGAFMKGAEEVARSPFPKLALEMTLLRLCNQGATLPLADVLEGLNRLEQRLDSGESIQEEGVPGKTEGSPTVKSEPRQSAGSDPNPTFKPTTKAPTSTETSALPVDRASARSIPSAEGSTQAAVQSAPPADITPDSSETDVSVVPIAEPDGLKPPWEPTVGTADEPSADATARGHSEGAQQASPAKAEEPAKVDAPAKVDTPAKPRPKEQPKVASGYKKRPTDGDYDDFSAEPVPPLPPEQLPDIKVKPRVMTIDLPEQEDSPTTNEVGAVKEELPSVKDETPVPVVEAADMPVNQDEPNLAQNEDPVELDPLSLEDGRTSVEHFAHLCGQVRKRDPFLASLIEQNTNLVEFTPTKLVLATGRSEGESLERAMFLLKSVLNEICSGPIELNVSTCDDDDDRLSSETLYNRKKRLLEEDNERRRASARTHPGIIQAVDILEAPITDVQTCDRREENG